MPQTTATATATAHRCTDPLLMHLYTHGPFVFTVTDACKSMVSYTRRVTIIGRSVSHLPQSFARLNFIEELNLTNNLFDTFEYPWLANFGALTSVDVAGNRLVVVPACLALVPRLRHLDVSRNAIASLPFHLVTRMRQYGGPLECIRLDGNPCVNSPTVDPAIYNHPHVGCGWYDIFEPEMDKARMLALAEFVFYPKWIHGVEGSNEVVSRNSAFEPKLVRLIWTFLSTAVVFRDRLDDDDDDDDE